MRSLCVRGVRDVDDGAGSTAVVPTAVGVLVGEGGAWAAASRARLPPSSRAIDNALAANALRRLFLSGEPIIATPRIADRPDAGRVPASAGALDERWCLGIRETPLRN